MGAQATAAGFGRRGMSDRERIAQIIYYGAVLLVGWLSFLIFQPFLVPLGWGAVLAVCVYPLHSRLIPRVGRSRAALLSTLIVLVLIVVPIWLLIQVLVSEVAQAVATLQTASASPPQPPEWAVRAWHWVQAHVPMLAPERLSASIATAAQRIGTAVAQGSGKVIGGVALLIVDLFVALFALFFFLRDAPSIIRMMRVFLPFDDSERDRILKQIGDLIYASVIAGLAVAAVQGCLGGLAFWLLGLEAPVVWGTVMAFFALLPVLGAWVVWLPVALYLALTGAITKALVLTAIGAGLVGMADNVLRPLLLSGRSSMNGLVTFVALLGGVAAFGFIGLVFGPVVVAVATALLDAYLAPIGVKPVRQKRQS
jgi:predicted PurR-regulated permease PerM